MDYNEFIKSKEKTAIKSGFTADSLSPHLFDFQQYIVKKALEHGRYAIFADTGLGKTLMQLSWAEAVAKQTRKPVLILAPLAVVDQTKREAGKFKIDIFHSRIDITNYDQLQNIDESIYM